jgi:3(or 17)beta-hydroxysteroid dehydrogenase
MGRVQGKVAIITGGASGLGEADAELLTKEGANVIIADVNEALGQSVADRIGATFARHDVTSEADWEKTVALAMEKFGKLDILVNNAAATNPGNIEVATLEDYRLLQRVNSEGTFLGCKYAVLAMKEKGGSIINMSSLAAIRGFPEVTAYSASKGAVISLTTTVATHCLKAGYAIRCNTILPGSTRTPMQELSEKQREGQSSVGMDRSRQRVGKPADIANLVVYLASDESVQTTGQQFVVDGGYSIQ